MSDISQNMKTFVDTKTVRAKPMTRGEYNSYRGWEMPPNENADDAGFLIELATPNESTGFVGMFTWTPKEQFERTHTPVIENQNPSPLIRWFEYGHLPPHLQAISKPIGDLAKHLDSILASGAEKTTGLRKLLEAKDAFVRALIEATPPAPPKQ